jgi:RNA polymerase sigma factor (sigma-70 family)
MDDPPTVIALLEAAQQGSQRAWTALVERYTPLVTAIVLGFRLQRSDAEDVAQTVWLRLVEHLRDLREPRALPMWIVTITRNECLRLIRTSQRTRPFDPTDQPAVVDRAERIDPDERLLAAERRAALLAAIAELPVRQRDLLLLLVADPPVSYAEITARMGIPVGSIGPTRARALERLRGSPAIAGWQGQGRDLGRNGGGRRELATLGQR